MTRLTCGVLVTDGQRLLLGHATGSPRWDIPKGLQEQGEPAVAAAVRELREETGLTVAAESLIDRGVQKYRPGKDLALFVWRTAALPDPASLRCVSTFTARNGRVLPEFDRFAIVTPEEGRLRVGASLVAVLDRVGWLGS